MRAAPRQSLVQVADMFSSEHDAEVNPTRLSGIPVITNDIRREEAGELELAVAIRCAHHGNLDMLTATSSDASGSFSIDHRPPFEVEAEFARESIAASRSWTTIPTLPIRSRAMFSHTIISL